MCWGRPAHEENLGTFLFNLSGWLLMACMGAGGVAAAWEHCAWQIQLILWMLSGSVACWSASLGFMRRVPPITPVTFVAAILLVQGWVMALNPVYKCEGQLFIPMNDYFSLLPGSWDGYSSELGMISFTVLFLVFHVAAGLLEQRGIPAAGDVGGGDIDCGGCGSGDFCKNQELPGISPSD